MNIKHISNETNLHDAHAVREAVFQKEQNVDRHHDFDGKDHESLNFVAYDEEKPVGTIRIRFPESHDIAKVERLAVLPEYRGKGVGKALMQDVHTYFEKNNVKQAYLDSQKFVKGFYEKLGYKQEGKEFDEVGIPHVKMVQSFA